MYAVEVRDHMMIAHSFRGALFGPAQRLHGATFVVDVAFHREQLTEDGVVVDIGRAHDVLKRILAPLNYRNLDDVPEFKGKNTTTEFLCRHIFDAMAAAARGFTLGAFHFSGLGHLAGMAEAYTDLQERIASLLQQAADNFDNVAGALTKAADDYQRDEHNAVHRMKNIY